MNNRKNRKETCFEIAVNDEIVYGIWHQPVENEKKTAVVFLHGWAGYRAGPHDLLVKIARHLTENGYDCFRFDFRGKGYSQGDRLKTNNQTMLGKQNLAEAITKRDSIKARIAARRSVREAAVRKSRRHSRNEVKDVRTVDIVKLQQVIDDYSKQYRELDIKIQERNWLVELL